MTEQAQTPTTAPAASRSSQPQGPRRGGPLSPQDEQRLVDKAKQVPGVGRMMLALANNRDAMVIVPETAMGREMIAVLVELDRVMSRGEARLARQLSLTNLQKLNEFQSRALGLIEPMAQLVAELAEVFDNPENPIVRHPRTKALVRELKAAKKATEGKSPAAHAEQAGAVAAGE